MVLALTGYETALVVVAASFIAFALVMALVIPRSRPEFPGKRLPIFLAQRSAGPICWTRSYRQRAKTRLDSEPVALVTLRMAGA